MEPERRRLLHEEITRSIIDSFFTVHGELGFGFREYVYALGLEKDLRRKGHKVEREVRVTVYFQGEPLTWQTLDMIVDDVVLVESKACERLPPITTSQTRGYLSATDLELGLVLHYGWQARFYRVICENRLKRHRRPRDDSK